LFLNCFASLPGQIQMPLAIFKTSSTNSFNDSSESAHISLP
jgi:hypothetical protein